MKEFDHRCVGPKAKKWGLPDGVQFKSAALGAKVRERNNNRESGQNASIRYP
jgi:hypothetical protein